MKSIRCLAIVLICLGSSGLIAQEEQETDSKAAQQIAEDTPFEKIQKSFSELEEDFASQRNEIMKAYQEAEDEDARQSILEKYFKSQEEMETKQMELGNQVRGMIEASQPNDETFEMVRWLFENIPDDELQAFAVNQMISDYLDHEKIVGVIPMFGSGMPTATKLDALEKLAEMGTSDEIQGIAQMTIAEMIHQNLDMAQMFVDNPESMGDLPDSVESFFKKIADSTLDDVEALYQKSAESFPDVVYDGSTIGEVASAKLKSLEIQKNLQVGKVAPDIEGPDIDGEVFKLSDYRGKVVMLDFWGHW